MKRQTSSVPGDQSVTVNTHTEYMGDVRAVMTPAFFQPRPEQRGMLVPEVGNMKGGADEAGTAASRMISMPSQGERLGARLRLDDNVHASMVEPRPGLDANTRTIPSSGAVHRDFGVGVNVSRL